eukprot:6190933-Pleurochrysis_carterae.AAC.4
MSQRYCVRTQFASVKSRRAHIRPLLALAFEEMEKAREPQGNRVLIRRSRQRRRDSHLLAAPCRTSVAISRCLALCTRKWVCVRLGRNEKAPTATHWEPVVASPCSAEESRSHRGWRGLRWSGHA